MPPRRPRASSATCRATRTRRTTQGTVDALVGIPEPIVRFLAERIATGYPGARAAARGARPPALPRVRPCTTCATRQLGGRPVVTADYALDGRPTHLVDARSRAIGRARRRRAAARRRRSRRPPARHQSVVDLYLRVAGGAGVGRRSPSRRCGDVLGGLPFARRVRRVAVAVCPAATGARSALHLPARTGRRAAGSPRGQPGPRRAPDGRPPARPVAAARLRAHPARRRPRTCCSTAASRRTTRADRRLVALAQVRELSVVRDDDGHGHVAAARRAGRRAAASTRSAGPGRAGPAVPARHEPRVAPHLAGHRRARRRS